MSRGSGISPGDALRRALGGVVIATHNQGKLEEYGALLPEVGVGSWTSAESLAIPEPEETGLTFEANAILKAEHAMRHAGHAALADDTGLCVDALDGAPGIHTKRWAMARGGWVAARRELARELGLLDAHPPAVSSVHGRFVCVVALAVPDQDGRPRTVTARADTPGRLVWPPRGDGPGFVPVFDASRQPFRDRGVLAHRRAAFEGLLGVVAG